MNSGEMGKCRDATKWTGRSSWFDAPDHAFADLVVQYDTRESYRDLVAIMSHDLSTLD